MSNHRGATKKKIVGSDARKMKNRSKKKTQQPANNILSKQTSACFSLYTLNMDKWKSKKKWTVYVWVCVHLHSTTFGETVLWYTAVYFNTTHNRQFKVIKKSFSRRFYAVIIYIRSIFLAFYVFFCVGARIAIYESNKIWR